MQVTGYYSLCLRIKKVTRFLLNDKLANLEHSFPTQVNYTDKGITSGTEYYRLYLKITRRLLHYKSLINLEHTL